MIMIWCRRLSLLGPNGFRCPLALYARCVEAPSSLAAKMFVIMGTSSTMVNATTPCIACSGCAQPIQMDWARS